MIVQKVCRSGNVISPSWRMDFFFFLGQHCVVQMADGRWPMASTSDEGGNSAAEKKTRGWSTPCFRRLRRFCRIFLESLCPTPGGCRGKRSWKRRRREAIKFVAG